MSLSLQEHLLRPLIAQSKPGCPGCGGSLQPSLLGPQATASGELCEDCYFDQLGAIVESHPIGRV